MILIKGSVIQKMFKIHHPGKKPSFPVQVPLNLSFFSLLMNTTEIPKTTINEWTELQLQSRFYKPTTSFQNIPFTPISSS